MEKIKKLFILFISATAFSILAAQKVTNVKTKPAPKSLNINLIIEQLQKQYNNTKSAIFNFSQEYTHPIFPADQKSTGQVFYKLGKMKWHYKTPAEREKLFYIRENNLIYYLPKEKLAYEDPCFKGG